MNRQLRFQRTEEIWVGEVQGLQQSTFCSRKSSVTNFSKDKFFYFILIYFCCCSRLTNSPKFISRIILFLELWILVKWWAATAADNFFEAWFLLQPRSRDKKLIWNKQWIFWGLKGSKGATTVNLWKSNCLLILKSEISDYLECM